MNGINQIHPLKEIRNRSNPVRIIRGFYDEDSFTYEIPEGYKPNLPPKNTIIEKSFGRYSSEVSVTGRTISYKRKMLFNEGSYKAEQYQELVDFFQEIADADGLMAILTKI
jgi:hypothetical protein